MHLARIPRRRYTAGQTPIEFLPNLSAELGAQIYIKRDDLLGLTSGGNKTRKLEFLMADALAKGADTIITVGAVQSNHCRLTLAAAVKEGLACHLLLEERVPGSYDVDASGNNLLYKLLGVSSIRVTPAGSDLAAGMEEIAEEVRQAGGTPYIIPGGGSNPLGSLGYVACAEEILAQTFEMGLPIDHLVTPSGSGGTHAGITAGLTANNAGIPITGISVRPKKEDQEPKIRELATQAARLAGADIDIPAEVVTVRDEFVGPGYSLPTAEMTEAIQLFARTEGILLDPVYTGKTGAGLIAMARAGEFGDGNVLFLHTGGSPAIYHYQQEVLGA
ncbi:MAG: D-cysteine desulfhydrase [Bowdeniella nasicola]|nr:D-cysteine desulfhydrase [Bowdeniella nasicola]